MKQGQNFNRPAPGRFITAEPIRDRKAIASIRSLLAHQPRNLCLFEMGIHTNLRIGDLLALTVGKVAGLKPGDVIPVRQQKRGKFGLRTINNGAWEALRGWLEVHPGRTDDGFWKWPPPWALFPGKDGRSPITREYASRLIKSWCRAVGLTGNFSAHSLRKTFGFHAINTHNFPIHIVSAAFGHRDIATTLLYLGIQDADVKELFMCEL